MRGSCLVQGADERNICIVGYLVRSVPCSNVQSLYIIITEYRWKYLYLSIKIIFTRFYTSSVAPLSKDERLSSCSSPSNSILRYVTPFNNTHLSHVILYTLFPFSLECTLMSLLV